MFQNLDMLPSQDLENGEECKEEVNWANQNSKQGQELRELLKVLKDVYLNDIKELSQ